MMNAILTSKFQTTKTGAIIMFQYAMTDCRTAIVALADVDETICASIHFEWGSTIINSSFPFTGPTWSIMNSTAGSAWPLPGVDQCLAGICYGFLHTALNSFLDYSWPPYKTAGKLFLSSDPRVGFV